MNLRISHVLTNIFIASVWFVNGFFCKVMDLVPRHRAIVAQILGHEFARIGTNLIGVGEILIAVWILSRIKSRFCAVFQMFMVGIMNIIEFVLIPDLLLFGRQNIVLATMFMILIYIHEFILGRRVALNQVA